jgi:hypothetical protein
MERLPDVTPESQADEALKPLVSEDVTGCRIQAGNGKRRENDLRQPDRDQQLSRQTTDNILEGNIQDKEARSENDAARHVDERRDDSSDSRQVTQQL